MWSEISIPDETDLPKALEEGMNDIFDIKRDSLTHFFRYSWFENNGSI
jgi:hypothetical protein